MIRTDINDHKELTPHLVKLGFKVDYYYDKSPNEDLYANETMEVFVNIEDNTVKLYSYTKTGTIMIFEGFVDVIKYINIAFKYELRKMTLKRLLRE